MIVMGHHRFAEFNIFTQPNATVSQKPLHITFIGSMQHNVINKLKRKSCNKRIPSRQNIWMNGCILLQPLQKPRTKGKLGENGICMCVLKLHPLINRSKIGTFYCTLLRIQRITKLHLPSWEMGFSWEAFSFLGLSFISSSLFCHQ